MKKLKILLKYKYILLTLVILVYSFVITNFIEYKSKYNNNTNNISGYISNINIDGDKLNIEIIGKEKIIGNYYFKDRNELLNFSKIYKLGDYINVVGELRIPKCSTVFNLFDYKKYLLQNGIYYIINIEKINKIKENNKIRYMIKQLIIDRIESISKSKRYLHAFILGEEFYIKKDVNNSYQINGISHLFAVSGSNISLIVLILLKVLNKFKFKYIIVFIFIIFYIFLTNFSASIIRSGIFFILLTINKIYKFNIKTIDLLLITLFISLLFDPNLLYSVGFQFSFTISLYLILFQNLIKKYKSGIGTLFIVSLISFLSSIPIVLSNFYQLNFLSLVLNIFFVPFVSIILFPLSLICFVLPFLDTLLFILTNILECLSHFFADIKFFIVILKKPSVLLIILYYLCITYSLYKLIFNKYIYLIIVVFVIFINYNLGVFQKYPEITFIDVGQGDSILISLPNNKNILLDTGGSLFYEKEKWQARDNYFSLGSDVVVPYLKSLGIKKIDYLILTHGDEDHMGEAIDILNDLKVSKVIMNKGCISNYEKSLINFLNNSNIKYSFMGVGDIISIDKYKFYILNPYKDINENDNSLVIYTVLNNNNILLMGDAGIEVENHLLNAYSFDIDILKVGHHGSKTSSSNKFISAIKPNFAVIQVGLNNKFKHPHNSVINTLNDNNIKKYLTSIDGSIKFIFKKNNVTILTTGT